MKFRKHRRFSWAFVWVVLGSLTLGLLCVLPLTNPPDDPAKPEVSVMPTVEHKVQRIPEWVFEVRQQGFDKVREMYTTPTPTP